MNIFILNKDLKTSAELLCDQHLNKQVLELAQVLSTNGYGSYRPTHKNHPVTLWAGRNLRFCFKYLEVLAEEYTRRTGKVHKSYMDTIKYRNNIPPEYIDSNDTFPIRNDLDLILEKYKEWASRDKPIYPRYVR